MVAIFNEQQQADIIEDNPDTITKPTRGWQGYDDNSSAEVTQQFDASKKAELGIRTLLNSAKLNEDESSFELNFPNANRLYILMKIHEQIKLMKTDLKFYEKYPWLEAELKVIFSNILLEMNATNDSFDSNKRRIMQYYLNAYGKDLGITMNLQIEEVGKEDDARTFGELVEAFAPVLSKLPDIYQGQPESIQQFARAALYLSLSEEPLFSAFGKMLITHVNSMVGLLPPRKQFDDKAAVQVKAVEG